jgi:TolB-like protein/DNA-binding winged helix-turn-helix (wHTH) protein/Flp pilus assembly protein TadD
VFEANLRARELRKHGIRVRLSGQPFRILAMLLERPGEVVTREEMRQRLWASDTFVDFEHSLNSAIKKIRRVLGDSAKNSRYLETLPRVGYRFIAPVEEIAPKERAEPSSSTASKEASASTETTSRSSRRWVALLAIPALLIAGLAAFQRWSSLRPSPKPVGTRPMLAVLPFENLKGDSAQDYFSDGLTEEMIAQLGRLNPEHLGVIARTSVMHYKNSPEQLAKIGADLGVQYVLEGSVRRDPSKVRITAQLIQISDQTPIWSQQYDRELSGLLALQGEVAQEIADEIQVIIGANPRRTAADRKPVAPPTSYEAYDLYLRGRYFWNKRTKDGFQRAADYFQQAIDKDPHYARAYAGLSDTFALMSSWSVASPDEFMPKARTAALRALQIDDTLAEAHASLALVAENYDYDWQTAEKEFKRAIQLDSGYPTAHQWYAECLSWQGRFDEALAESERARQLDPLSLIIATDHGAILYFARQYDRAIEQFRVVLAMDRNFPRAFMISQAYVEKGMFTEALREADNWRHSDGTLEWETQAYIFGREGQQEQARHALENWQRWYGRRETPTTAALVMAYIAMGRTNDAIALLRRASSEHSPAIMAIKVAPYCDPLRSDPRFLDLLRRVGLANSYTGTEPK